MDTVLSTLFPTYRIGSDGFSWWIGQVENNKDIKNSGRVQVRIVGVHHKEGDVTSTDDLPWAHVMMPANVPYVDGGTTGATNNLQIGAWVIGFYLDTDCQRPLVIGSIAHTQASTTKPLQDYTPDLKSLGFKPTRAVGVNPAIHRPANEQSGTNQQGANTEGGEPAAKKSANSGSCPAVLGGLKGKNSPTNPTGGKQCVELADANCNAKDLGTGIKKIIGDILSANQASSGQIGSYYVSQVNGLLYSAIDIPRKYIDKISRLITSFSLRVKAEIVYGIRQGIEELIKLIMGVETAKATAEAAADKAKNPLGSYVPNTEHGNFLKQVIDTINKVLNELGCSFTKTLDDLIQYVIDLVMEYLQDAFNAAFCLIDNVVDKIVKFLESAFNDLISLVLGPIQEILGTAGSFLDVIGGAISRVLDILGISCTGVKSDCNKNKTKCSDGSTEDKKEDEKDFLDKLIDEIEKGSLTGKKLGSVSRGVCEEAKTTPAEQETTVEFVGGVPNKPVTSDYVATTTTIPDIPIQQIEFPEYTDLPNAVATPDATFDDSEQVDYRITAQQSIIKEGEIARFDVVGPDRNGVIDIEILQSTVIPSEANEEYEPCLIESGDGKAVAFEIQFFRDENGVPNYTILNSGRGYLVGMEFTLNGAKLGGDADDDIVIRIKTVGELINYRVFGDVYDKNLIDPEIYPEFGSFTYTEPRTFSFPTIDGTTNQQPSFIGLEFLQKRAADSVTIWDEEPSETYPEEEVSFSSVTLETNQDVYEEGQNVTYTVTTQNIPDGTIYEYRVFGTVDSDDYTSVSEKLVTIQGSSAKFIISLNIDSVFEKQEVMTVLLFGLDDEGNFTVPVASKTITIVDDLDTTTTTQTPFTLTPNTTQKQLEDFLNSSNITTRTDFGQTTINLPPDLGALTRDDRFDEEPDNFESPIAGTPVVDTDGSIISIPISYPGNRSYQIPPKVVISGQGYGAAGIALLDKNGFVSEIRVTRIGIGYTPNPPDPDINGLQCVIDSFTIVRPGFGYTEAPTVYVDDDPNVAEVTIDKNGFINGVRVLNRSKSYDTIPRILVVGGGGAGGFVLPSLVCLPPVELEQKGYIKIGTGSYIDCP